jgi:hypothetical protein
VKDGVVTSDSLSLTLVSAFASCHKIRSKQLCGSHIMISDDIAIYKGAIKCSGVVRGRFW